MVKSTTSTASSINPLVFRDKRVCSSMETTKCLDQALGGWQILRKRQYVALYWIFSSKHPQHPDDHHSDHHDKRDYHDEHHYHERHLLQTKFELQKVWSESSMQQYNSSKWQLPRVVSLRLSKGLSDYRRLSFNHSWLVIRISWWFNQKILEAALRDGEWGAV